MSDVMMDAVIAPGATPNDLCLILFLNPRLSELVYRRQVVFGNAKEQIQFAERLKDAGYRVGTIAEAMTYPTTRAALAGHTDVWSEDFLIPNKTAPYHDA